LIGREEEGVLSVEDWAEIRRLHRAEGLSIKMISRVMKMSRNTVRAALASGAPPKYQRRPAPSIVDAFEPRIRELLTAFPTMPATVIAERVGWTRGQDGLRRPGAPAAAGVSAAGSGRPDQLRGW
jgi:transposase